MLEKIKNSVFDKYSKAEQKGIFASGFDENGNLLFSSGVLDTNAKLDKSLDQFYNQLISKYISNIKVLVIDIVLQIADVTTSPDLLKMSVKEYGFAILDTQTNKSGTILPNTEGVADVKNALFLIQQKHGLGQKVKIFAFKTDRIVLSN